MANKPNARTIKALKEADAKFMASDNPPKIGSTSTLCGQLEDAITMLENRVSNSIAKINSLM
jgi:hypothetical protein